MHTSPSAAKTIARALPAVLLAFALAACHRKLEVGAPAPAAKPSRAVTKISDGRDVIAAMHERYEGKWYHTVTFRQKTTVGLASGRDLVQNWLEAAELPGRLRIDTDVPPKGNGTLFANDSVYSFSGGKLVHAAAGVNDLLVLGFDVYAQPAITTERVLVRRGFDLNKLHESTWQGRPAYVVGAAQGDTTSKQFWIDKERLVFVRMIEPSSRGRSDIRFNQYVRSGNGWIAAEVEQLVDGKRRLLEQYSDIHSNVPLSDNLFEPRHWSSASHWYQP